MRIEPAEPYDMKRVAMNMRNRDFVELGALSPATNRTQLADLLALHFGHALPICAWDDDDPVAIGAVVENRPNVGTLLFYATDDFHRVATGLTRWITKELFPRCKANGMHRIECLSIEGYEQTHRWIEILGLKREAIFPKYGRDGQTFIQFAWVRPD